MTRCKPLAKVLSADIETVGTETVLMLLVNRYIFSIGANCPFILCIPRDVVTNSILGADPLTLKVYAKHIGSTNSFPLRVGCTGNFLRADQLRKFLRCNTRGCCPTFDFNCVLGLDDRHITVHNRFCPSVFTPVTVTTAPEDVE